MLQFTYCIEYFYAKPGCEQSLKEALQQLIPLSLAEQGCLQYECLVDKAQTNLFIIVAKFKNAEAQLIHEAQPFVLDFAINSMLQYCEKFHFNDALTL